MVTPAQAELCVVGISAGVAGLVIGATMEAFIGSHVPSVGMLRISNGVQHFSEDELRTCRSPRLAVFVGRHRYRIGLAILRSIFAEEAAESAWDTSGEWLGGVDPASLRHELARAWDRLHYDGEVIVAAADEASLQAVIAAVDAASQVMQRERQRRKVPPDVPRHRIVLAPAGN